MIDGLITRGLVAAVADACGVSAAARTLLRRPALLVLTYHRIGCAAECEYDAGVYSADTNGFYEQIEHLRRHYPVLTLDEALVALKRPGGLRRPAVLLTFDDGYRDNYSIAFPLLKSMGLQATFFLSTCLVGTNTLAWWDQVAYTVRHARRPRFKVAEGMQEIDLTRMDVTQAVGRILRWFKSDGPAQPAALVADVAAACDGPVRQCAPDRQFVSWEEAGEMLEGGMALGSHTHSHRLLGRLTPEEQMEEVVNSRNVFRQRLGIVPRVMALPCGSSSLETPSILARAGYEAAFSTRCGVNLPEAWDFYSLRRIPVDRSTSLPLFRLRVALALGLHSKAI